MAAEAKPTDRFGLGWRPPLAAAILANLDDIDVVEVIADDYFDASPSDLRALRRLARHVPVVLHGIGLGLASSIAVDERRLAAMARVVDAVEPLFWSEHLAFVRAGGVEIGHLAAPPRNADTIAGTERNVERARAVVGSTPLLENVATLVDPPSSDRDECAWISEIRARTGCQLLLDLHNLHANATNFRFNPFEFIARLSPDSIVAIHLAGGRWIHDGAGRPLVLDDHLHDVPLAVYDLLEHAGRHARGPLTVILERDGRYPSIGDLTAQIRLAKHVLNSARATPEPVVRPTP